MESVRHLHAVRRIALAAVAVCAAFELAACAAPVGNEAFDGAAQPLSNLWVGNFHGQSARLATDYDWAYGFWKGECGGASPILMGLSKQGTWERNFFTLALTEHWYHQAVLCGAMGVRVDTSTNYVLSPRSANDRRDTSTGDWAPGSYKAECGPTDVVVGVAQDANMTDAPVAAVRCMATSNLLAPTSCTATDEQLSETGGDWSYGYYKAQCGDNQYVKGVAQFVYYSNSSNTDKGSSRILCCTPNYKPLIIGTWKPY